MDLEPPIPSSTEQVQELERPRLLTAGRALAILAAFLVAEFAVAAVVAIVAVGYYTAINPDHQALTTKLQTFILFPATLIGSLVGSVVALRMTRRSFPGSVAAGALKPLGWSAATPRTLAANVLLGSLIAAGVEFLLIRSFPPHSGQSFGPVVQAAATPGLSRLGWALVALALAPPIEEFLFRGILLSGFTTTWGLTAAILLSSALFILFHVPDTRTYWPALAGISLLTAATVAVRLSTKALLPAIALHFGYNLFLVVLVYARAA